ncbi:MAG: alpha/beta fold hydrolase, partial [Acidimicrobiales bacterium]
MTGAGPGGPGMGSLVADDAGSGPVVLLLHGQPGRARDWHRVQARLTDSCRVLIPDRLGYGRTGGRAAGFAANADACLALLDRLGVDRAVVAGHSWAGAVALALAEHHRDRVAGLALVASVAPGEVPGRL